MKLLTGKTAPWWPRAISAAPRGGEASTLDRNPTTSLGFSFMLQKGYFLAIRMDSNAVVNLFPEDVSIPKESAALGSERQREKWVLCLHLPCRPEPPCEFPIARTVGL